MNELMPNSQNTTEINTKEKLEVSSLTHLEAHYKEENPKQLKWYENSIVQMLFSTLWFALISFMVISLLILFSDQLGVFINARRILTAHIGDNLLLYSANHLRVEAELLNSNQRLYALKLASNLENAANELDKVEQFTLKSRTKSAPLWLQTAIVEYTRQNQAKTYNNRILQYISTINENPINVISQPNVSWSSHFVNWIMQKANIIGIKDEKPSSWLKWGKPLTEPKPGAIAIFKLGLTYKYEIVGFFLLTTKNYDIILAGDVLSNIGVVAFEKTNLLGYRWPKE